MAVHVDHIDLEGCPRPPWTLSTLPSWIRHLRRVRLHAAPVGEAHLVQAADAVNIRPC